jgi:hypothetical protein
VLSLDVLLEESNCRTALLGLLSSGADPTSNIQALAKKKAIDLCIVSMGQGQEILARPVAVGFSYRMLISDWIFSKNFMKVNPKTCVLTSCLFCSAISIGNHGYM